MQTITIQDLEELGKAGSKIVEREIAGLLASKETVTIALAGGTSVGTIYRALPYRDIDWSRVHLVMVDDKRVPVTDEQSNYRLVAETMVSKLVQAKKLPPEQVHPYLYDQPIEAYTALVEELNGIDLVILSAGEDGHIAGLYPNHTITRNDEGFFTFDDSPKPPAKRMSASRKLITSAEVGIVLFTGEHKREALNTFRDPNSSIVDCPAKLVTEMVQAYVLTNLDHISDGQ